MNIKAGNWIVKAGNWIKFNDYEHPNPTKNSCISTCEIAREHLGIDWRRVDEVFPNGGGDFKDADGKVYDCENIPFVKISHGRFLGLQIPLKAISSVTTLISEDEELLVNADAVATDAHLGQWRKFQPNGAQVCYKVHLDRMDQRLLDAGISSAIIRAASKCHDTIEDGPEGTDLIVAKTLGSEVFALVHQLTNPSKKFDGKLNRAARKEIDCTHLRMVSAEAAAIKLVDLTDNALDVGGAELDFKRLFLSESLSLFDALLSRLDQCPGGKYGYPPHRKIIKECENALHKLESNLEANR